MSSYVEGIEGLKNLLSDPQSVSYIFHLINLIVVCIFFIIKENVENKKAVNKKFNYGKYLILVLFGSIIGSLLLLIIGSIAVLFSPFVGSICADIIFDKFITHKDKKTNDDKKEDEVNVSLPENTNFTNLDIITVLDIYGYISQSQKERLLETSLLETPDDMAKKLLSMTSLEKKELNEAYALLNLAKLKHKLVSKEEARKYLEEYNSQITNFNNRR